MNVRASELFEVSTDPRVTSFVGVMSRVRRVSVDDHARLVSAESMRASLGDLATPRHPTLEDVCPDPLVFAIESGLPRIRLLDRQIDGGSLWLNSSAVPTGDWFFAVSHIRAVEERRTAAGRRLMRAHYTTAFSTRRGVSIGSAVGYSLDLEVTS